MRKILIVTTVFAALAFGAGAQTTPSISVENAWARPTTASAQAAAIYLTITDHGTARPAGCCVDAGRRQGGTARDNP